MFKKKVEKPKRNHAGKSLSQYGLFEIPSDFDTGVDNADEDGDDDDFEAELAALASGNGPTRPKRPPRKVVPQADLDNMVAQSLRDIPSDEEVSGDDDDPDLLNELSMIADDDSVPVESSPETPPNPAPASDSSDIGKLLNERLKLYQEAEKVAKTTGETSRARRFNRGIKTLQSMIKETNAGNSVNEADIPPEVRIGPPSKPAAPAENNVQPTRPAPEIPAAPSETPSEPIPEPEPSEQPPTQPDNSRESAQNTALNTELLDMLTQRQKEYKIAALQAKKAGDPATALNYLKIVKQFDMVLEAVNKGEPVDLSRMPGPPGESKPKERIEEDHVQQSADSDPPAAPVEEPEEAGGGLITASTVLEALEQRLAVYKAQESSAKEQGSSSKARRYGRLCKQFEDAIKLHKAGKPIDLEELPTPPGYAPIPGSAPPKPPVVKPAPKPPATVPNSANADSPSPSQPGSANVNKQATIRADKQILILLAKQKQFKVAALNAKKKGEIAEAKEFLRTAKGFDRLIEAAKGGLPIDWASIPVSPEAKSQLDNEYDMVMADECTDDNTGSLDILTRLENQLTKQLKMCLSTRDHNKALGDVAGMNRFERLALTVTKDLDTVRMAHRTPDAAIPKFHYEKKDFSIVKSFTDLGDNDLELNIVRGVNFATPNPKEIDTYVKFEFPFPQDTPFSEKTATVKDTNNPEYNHMFMIPIQRTSRICQRVFKRHGIKFEVYSKGGFFRSDTLLGTVNVKLQPLETQCELHESFDLLEGRKKVGGKLEVHLRLRHPIVAQQVEQIQEKWLVIDQ